MFTFEDLERDKPKKIYYSANTLWWTHDPKDLVKGPVPLDCFDSPLFESETNIKELKEKGYNQNFWMAAHAKNINKVISKMVPRSNAEIARICSDKEEFGKFVN